MERRGLLLLSGAVAAIGVVAGIVWFYRTELDRAQEAAGRGSKMIGTDAGPIEYGVAGAGVPLFSIHGAGGGFDQGLANAGELVGDGFRVIAPSRFGYLRTPVPRDASPAAQAEAHAALLTALGVSRATILGISAGARSAVELALHRPEMVEALVLIVPATYSPSGAPSVDASRGSRLAFGLVSAGVNFGWCAAENLAPSMLIRFLGVAPELLRSAPRSEHDRVMRVVRTIRPLSLRFRGINLDSAAVFHELPLEQITAPALIITARDDRFDTAPAAEFAAGKILGAKLIVYDRGGHLLIGHGLEVRTAVRAFLVESGVIALHSPIGKTSGNEHG